MSPEFSARIADAYSQYSDTYVSDLEPSLVPMASTIADMAGMKPGQRALDLATGTGLIARALAQSQGSVIGADLSLGILKLARENSGRELEYVAADAQMLPFGDQCLDLITCGLSLSHFPDVSVALSEIRRLLRPGGRFITSAWGLGGEAPAKQAAVKARARYLPEREETFGGLFNEDLWAEVGTGEAALQRAGFVGVGTSSSRLSGRYVDHEAAIRAALAWPITRYRVAQLPPEEQQMLVRETEAAIRGVSDLNWWTEIHYYQATRPSDP